jgi:hypothetical protein
MCRNIRVLHNFQPPTTPEEIRDASLQFVRKVSGLHHPPQVDNAAFERAVNSVTAATTRLLDSLHKSDHVRTREGEREKARLRWQKREASLRG